MPITKRGKTGQRLNWWIILPVWLFCGIIGFALTNVWINPSLRTFFTPDYWHSVSKFEEALRLVNAEYVEQNKSGMLGLTNQAIQGMVSKLDRHSQYFNQAEYDIFHDDTHRTYVGVGIMIRLNEKGVVVTRVFPGSPAIESGLAIGDVILRVNDLSVEGNDLEQISNRIKGEPGTKVNLSVKSLLGKTKDIEVTRKKIIISSVDVSNLDDNGTGYIHIVQFTEKTGKEVEGKLEAFKQRGMQRIIIDLRDNAGGLLSGAIEVASLFVPENESIVTVKGRGQGQKRVFTCKKDGPYVEMPIAILLNEGSASASEIVAGALSKAGRAILVGEKSFGKGSVQTVFSLMDGTGMKLTTAMYFFSDGTTIHETGVQPEHLVPCSDENETKLRLQRYAVGAPSGKSFFDLFGFTKIQDEQLLAAQTLLLSSEGNSSK